MDSCPYEYSQEIELEDVFADLCVTIAEMDAVVECQTIMEVFALEYQYSRDPGVKNIDRNLRTFNKLMDKATTKKQQREVLSFVPSLLPLETQTQRMKAEATKQANDILQGAGIGKKRRLLILPHLISLLNIPPLLPPQITFIKLPK